MISQLAEYYYHRADYFIAVGEFKKGVSRFLKAPFHFSRVDDVRQEKQCTKNDVTCTKKSFLSQMAGWYFHFTKERFLFVLHF